MRRAFDRLGRMDLLDLLGRFAPRPVVQLAVAVALIFVVVVIRLLINLVAPGVAPFALLYPAILIATLAAGGVAGAMALIMGSVLVWFYILTPRPGFPHGPADLVTLALFMIAGGAIIAVAEAHRAGLRALKIETALRFEARERAIAEQQRLFKNARGFVILLEGPDHIVRFVNAAGERLVGGGPLLGLPLRQAFPEAEPDFFAMLDRVRASRKPHSGQALEVKVSRGDHKQPSEPRFIDFIVEPLSLEAEDEDRLMIEGFEVTDLLRGRAALEETQTRLELATAAGRIGIWEWRPEEKRVVYSPEARQISGLSPDQPLTFEEVTGLIHPDEKAIALAQVRDAMDPEVRADSFFEYRLIRPDGEQRWAIARGRATFEEKAGRQVVTRFVGTLQDITPRKTAEERLRLLAREVNHRANNLLAVVQGTIQLSKAATAEGLREVLIGRVRALGRAHQLLSEARWEGADLRRLVEEELGAFNHGQAARTWIDGPEVALTPAAAQGLAMALHELATNAAKYGSLSNATGQVAVTWERCEGGLLKIVWTESGGPPVTTPVRRGLGSTMLERALSGPLKGTTRMDWRPDGLVCTMEFPEAAGRLQPATI